MAGETQRTPLYQRLLALKDRLVSIGIWFIPILALSFGRFVLRSYAWLTLLKEPAPLFAAVAARFNSSQRASLAATRRLPTLCQPTS